MKVTEMTYEQILKANPMIPVLALAMVKRVLTGDVSGAHERRNQFIANYPELVKALDTCILSLIDGERSE